MNLFDTGTRTQTRFKLYSETEFEYLNQSARPAVIAFRALLEDWFQQLPSESLLDLRSRFRADDHQHAGAFFELYLFILLSALGYRVTIHPILPDTGTHPDFHARRDDGCEFYLEATLAGIPSKREQGEEARISQVYDVLNRMESPNFFLHVNVTGVPSTPPPAAKLRRDIERWLDSLDVDEVSMAGQSASLDSLPKLAWEHDGWHVVFTAIAKSPEGRNKPGVRPIGAISPEAQWLQTDMDLKSALVAKTKKYGTLQLPLVLAVNVLGVHCDRIDIMNALFGQETVTVSFQRDGTIGPERAERKKNGFWFGPQGPRNQTVNAVLIATGLNEWNMGSLTPELFHNPWAIKPLNPDCWGLPQSIPNMATNQYDQLAGTSARDIMCIPNPWPTSWE